MDFITLKLFLVEKYQLIFDPSLFLLVLFVLIPSVIIDRYQWLLLRYKRIEFVAVGLHGFDSICFLSLNEFLSFAGICCTFCCRIF